MTSLNEIKVIIFSPFGDKQWKTGGERRLSEIQKYFKMRTKNFNVISYSDFPFRINAIHFLQANIWLFQKIKSQCSGKNRTVFIYPNICSLPSFLTTILLRISCHIKIILTVEHFKNPISGNLKSFLGQGVFFVTNIICLHNADLIIVVSKEAQRECRKMRVKESKIRIVSNGIDKIPIASRKEGIGEEGKTVNILSVGYCAKIKGVFYLVDAVRLLTRQGQSNYFLYFVGDTQKDRMYYKKIERYICANSLNNRIKFCGQLYNKDLEYLWEKADMFILPSLWESFGLAIAEAMIRGIPVIATNAGAIPGLVTDGVSGLLVPPRDSCSLAEAIKRLTKDFSLRKKVIEGGYRVAADISSWEESCEKFYQQILSLFNNNRRTERESCPL